jgi:glucosyl-dolichyl phosphate glucuronosyltransferase
MKITIILCTSNRCDSLGKTLDSMTALQMPETVEWEVLVVDNNSTDRTRQVVEEYCRRYIGRFRYLFESQQGKSYALNAGVREAQGDILAFTDDDVTVDPLWLHNLTAALHEDRCSGSGGRTLPEQAFSPPPWLAHEARYALAPLAIFDRGLEPRELDEAPFGNNMAFKKSMFEQYGGFRTDLGVHHGGMDPQKGEDSEFGVRLLSAGERLRYEAAAIVYHAVPANRVQKEYFLDWWFDKGRSDTRAFGIPSGTRWFIAGIPLYLFRRLAVWTLRWMVGVSPSQRFSSKIKVWALTGAIVECRRGSRVRKRSSAQPGP